MPGIGLEFQPLRLGGGGGGGGGRCQMSTLPQTINCTCGTKLHMRKKAWSAKI